MTSLFDAFDIELCRKVFNPLMLGSLDLERLFHQVSTSANLFSIPLDGEGNRIRYHHLFQHFLRSQLQYEFPTMAWNIQQILAQVYEQERKIEDALQIYEQLTIIQPVPAPDQNWSGFYWRRPHPDPGDLAEEGAHRFDVQPSGASLFDGRCPYHSGGSTAGVTCPGPGRKTERTIRN